MLHCILISDNREADELLGALTRASSSLILERVVPAAPGSYALTMALHTMSLDVIFLDIADVAKAKALSAQIRDQYPKVPIIGFDINGNGSHTNVTRFTLGPPFSVDRIEVTVREAVTAGAIRPYENIAAILPAKAGGGASTIAVNTAGQLGRRFGKRVLVAECDLRSGAIAETLDLQPKVSMGQTLQLADSAETLIWTRHVCSKDGVDFLLTAREPDGYRPEWHDYHHLLSFVSKKYDFVIFDLPELINSATSEVVRAAKTVYVMTTPEFISLKLARQRLAELRSAGATPQAVRILVNRHHSSDPSPDEIADLLECPVELAIPNDYRTVQAAAQAN